MNIKSLIIVIIISIATGVAIFWFSSKPTDKALTNSTPKEVPATSQTIATPTPLPSQPPIDKNTDLEAEIQNQVSPDFNEDYKKLKEEVNQSF